MLSAEAGCLALGRGKQRSRLVGPSAPARRNQRHAARVVDRWHHHHGHHHPGRLPLLPFALHKTDSGGWHRRVECLNQHLKLLEASQKGSTRSTLPIHRQQLRETWWSVCKCTREPVWMHCFDGAASVWPGRELFRGEVGSFRRASAACLETARARRQFDKDEVLSRCSTQLTSPRRLDASMDVCCLCLCPLLAGALEQPLQLASVGA